MTDTFFSPGCYTPRLTLRQTERAVKLIKDEFEKNLAAALHLERISAPLFIRPESGLNDNLSGVERPVRFDVPSLGASCEIVHSLAKWKRQALERYGFVPGTGLYTDMNAIRRDETLDCLHSIYVDQWDWECVITDKQRTAVTLEDTVLQITRAIAKTLTTVRSVYPAITLSIPEKAYFITSQELLDRYPSLSAKERENAICRERGCVFLMQIGAPLSNGQPHDSRAPDYDDWSLNGDLLYWDEVHQAAIELSSMGVRVDAKTLASQLEQAGCQDRASLPFHAQLLAGQLPQTMGGGIGQSRLCMFLLQMAHIGQVQASIWSEEMTRACHEAGIELL